MSSESNKQRVYHGAYGLCRDPSDRLLLVRVTSGLADAGLWTLPGGGIEWGEHPEGALFRELEEETGVVDIERYRLVAVYSQVYEHPADRPDDSVYITSVLSMMLRSKSSASGPKKTDRQTAANGLPKARLDYCRLDNWENSESNWLGLIHSDRLL